ncbi:MAG TPA: lysylphosphatidylglycerol synthase domain-containing protein [Lacibacter sp.]|nr:lysylphosphatidylglycerol synthase domain-containing protein [Lacibacter sp.]HMO87985.1 lysylphosphatidylglycerol synthase domain-containing protein [Lacibacter sp.]
MRQQPDLPAAWQQLRGSLQGSGAGLFWLAVLLMPVNWSLETWKWHLLVNRYQPLSFLQSLESVLSGLSLSLNTPNRIGEYGGRVLYLQPGFRLKGVALSILSSLSQLLVTLLLGWVALLVMRAPLSTAGIGTPYLSGIFFTSFQYILLFVTAGTALFYFRIHWLMHLLKWVPLVKKKLSFVLVLEEVTNGLLLRILLLSFVRFLVFAGQYLLIWYALGVTMDPWQGFWCTALIFMVMAIIPTFAIAEIGIRGQVAVTLAGMLSANMLGLVSGTVVLWLLNLVLPALVGSLFLLTLKLFQER